MSPILTWSKISQIKLLLKVSSLKSAGGTSHQMVEFSEKAGNFRKNELGLQMIPKDLQEKIFGSVPNISSSTSISGRPKPFYNASDDGTTSKQYSTVPMAENLCLVKDHLSKHGIWDKTRDSPKFPVQTAPDIMIELPELKGSNIEDHFENLGREYSDGYKMLADDFCLQELPPPPNHWVLKSGWTKYTRDASGNVAPIPVDFPDGTFIVLDVETCVKHNNRPVICTALSEKSWYSWCSPILTGDQLLPDTSQLCGSDLIPIGSCSSERVIVGHNVSFDRSYLKEQYELECDKTRFLDTMSLHISISGLTGYQRALSYSHRSARNKGVNEGLLNEMYKMKKQPNPIRWEENGSLNSLKDVYGFYCKDQKGYRELHKETRSSFVEGSLDDIRNDFQNLMSYCGSDVWATCQVFKKLWPHFLERFPHPVTLAGILEMSIMYLPVDSNRWKKYITKAQNKYDEMEKEVTTSLSLMADETCSQFHRKKYQKDVWLWDLDWMTQNIRFRKDASLQTSRRVPKKGSSSPQLETHHVKRILGTQKNLKKIQPLLAGYPLWYRELCSPHIFNTQKHGYVVNDEWQPGPHLISTQMRSVPKIMKLMWDGYALHHSKKYGWGFLVPKVLSPVDLGIQKGSQESVKNFPYEEYIKIVNPVDFPHEKRWIRSEDSTDPEYQMYEAVLDFPENNSRGKLTGDRSGQESPSATSHHSRGLFSDDEVPGCRFYKLPHREGPESNVGNPLSRDFLKYVEEGRLTAYGNDVALRILKVTSCMSYWKMSWKRIVSQMVVDKDGSGDGAILPRVIVSGTVTRRAVEPTWLTASNAHKERVGSELKGMISAPEGYAFVGADVDSQELWIASLLGDSYFARIHGSTGIGWMTLEGSKECKTDMHSRTASLVNISRDEAKVLNYGRIYGAGKTFAARYLRQSNPALSESDARKKANEIYKKTKGNRSGGRWMGGSESHMFNMLEAIARGSHPATPVLGCRVSRALEAAGVREDFMTSIINWVVQSSAVDFLHLMLVSMKWLSQTQGIKGRFAISIHDEVRYLISHEDRYRAALALQMTNLLTRSMFCARLGMRDMPLSVAFFSAVEIDSVLRKEVHHDCVTPSNPEGLASGYGTPPGESLNINQLLHKLHNQT